MATSLHQIGLSISRKEKQRPATDQGPPGKGSSHQVDAKHNPVVTPAEVGVYKIPEIWDSCLRGRGTKDLKNDFIINLLLPHFREGYI